MISNVDEDGVDPTDGLFDEEVAAGPRGMVDDEGEAGTILCTPPELDELLEFPPLADEGPVVVGPAVVPALDGGENGWGLKMVKERVMLGGRLRRAMVVLVQRAVGT